MTGFSDAREAAILDAAFTSTTYLRLLTATTAGLELNDNGTFPVGLSEVSTGGYAPLAIPANYWASAVQGAPTTKTMPTPTHSPVTFTPSGVAWDLTAWALTSDNGTITGSNFLYGGVFIDAGGTKVVYHVYAGQPLTFTDTYPLVVRLGDPPSGTNPI